MLASLVLSAFLSPLSLHSQRPRNATVHMHRPAWPEVRLYYSLYPPVCVSQSRVLWYQRRGQPLFCHFLDSFVSCRSSLMLSMPIFPGSGSAAVGTVLQCCIQLVPAHSSACSFVAKSSQVPSRFRLRHLPAFHSPFSIPHPCHYHATCRKSRLTYTHQCHQSDF